MKIASTLTSNLLHLNANNQKNVGGGILSPPGHVIPNIEESLKTYINSKERD